MNEITKISIDILIATAPCLSFLIQAFKIKKQKSSYGFSKIIVLILMLSNILRIFFWIGRQFGKPLLIQSFNMIITQIFLLYTLIKYEKDSSSKEIQRKPCFNFWNWVKFKYYIYFILIFIVFLSFLSIIITFSNETYVNILGIFSTGIESLLGIPQLITNYQMKYTKNISIVMLLLWILGDSSKIIYYLYQDSPIHFIYCGEFQLVVDFLIVFQVFYYRDKEVINSFEELDDVSTSQTESIDKKIGELSVN